VSVTCDQRTDADCTLKFSIKDTGIGIDEDKMAKLFQPFQQGDSSTTRRYGGTGLGLAISKRLVELLGGTIWIESQVGVGSTFIFTSRFQISNQVDLTKSQLLGLEGREAKLDRNLAGDRPMKILVAEDNKTNQKVVLMILSRLGYSADIAENGNEVLRMVSAATYDLILMDIQMPEMNGMEATRILREQIKNGPPAIIALTAEAMEGDRERFLEAGFDGYLSKPVEAMKLQGLLKFVPLGGRT